MKHTPGPWEQHTDNKTFVYAQSGELVAKALSPVGLPNRAEANARLIAAAPDLLEAARKVIVDASNSDGTLCRTTSWTALKGLQAEIAKATNA